VVVASALLLVAGRAEPNDPVLPPTVDRFTLRDSAGMRHELADWRDDKAVVLFVLCGKCPVFDRYTQEMNRLARLYGKRGVSFFGVQPDPAVTAETAASHAAEHGFPFPVLLDPSHELVGDTGVKSTPEAVLLDGEGHVLYRGRIDDRVNENGKVRDQPRSRDLADALDAVLADRLPKVAETRSFGCPLPPPAPLIPEGKTVTFTNDVAPILWNHCAPCHRPGEVGPFPLLSYRDAAKRADFLVDVTQSRRMPPSKALHGYGDHLDNNLLSRRELAVLERWAETGAAEGDPADLPPAPKFIDGWRLGTPDLVLTMPESFTVPAGGGDYYQAFVLPIPLQNAQSLAALEFRPGNRKVVHHARFYFDPTNTCRKQDAAAPGPGFIAFGGAGINKPGLGAWVPGVVPRFPPADVGKTIPKGSDFILLIHYHGTGKPEADASSIGLYFHDKPAKRRFTFLPLSSDKIDISAGEKRHRMTLTYRVPADSHAYSVLPHGHFLMREISLTAVLPTGKTVPMLWVPDWDFNWQGQYHFARPVALPKGTLLHVVAYYDNSRDNPSNPNDPPCRVRFGWSSTDEMLGCHVQVLADDEEGQDVYDKKYGYGL
jgi:peroxiredoxin